MGVLIDGLVCAVLVFVAVEDARRFRIRNGAVALLVALFGLAALVSGTVEDAAWHGVFGAAVLVLMFGAFSARLVGAGDAKLMTAACLWTGPENALTFALILFGLTVLYGIGAALRLLPARRDGAGTKIPFGPSIAVAWIATIALV
ncbi:prepilin peptidase [Methylobacterium sp. J-090]|uniref:A24 family peptidase n=1 Tax=Methylobacterium sp. J-090 TaxID=2836666 RepID=UPI001FBA2718|nr:prepilin peptidase [Methylobacterium sp. J-090]MCJ2082583.1 prepilin peptidase [Methylobacterium sp. J-090]